MNRFATLILALPLALGASLAAAQTRTSDGVVNLHHDAALAGSATPGDSAGYPISITTSGSYRLTSNLVVPAGVDGIVVQPGLNVHLDLNGFQIVGPAVCSLTSNCYVHLGTAGVRSESKTSTLSLRNGRVRGFSRAGVLVESDAPAIVEDLRAIGNGNGVDVFNVQAQRVAALDNASVGISAFSGRVDASWVEKSPIGIRATTRLRLTETSVSFCGLGLQADASMPTMVQGIFFYKNTTAMTGAVTAAANVY